VHATVHPRGALVAQQRPQAARFEAQPLYAARDCPHRRSSETTCHPPPALTGGAEDHSMPIPSKCAPTKIAASEWQTPGAALRGLLEGKNLNTGVTLIRYVTDVVGQGPTLHVHPYDEIFTITEGRARFTVGDRTIDAEAGDIVLGPANVPHGYQNLGPGRLDTLDIHLSPEWIQYNLASGWDESSVLVSARSKVDPDAHG
jgi:mannose-6-phosphate isomerase-like protein (cupin superfamily)